MPYKQLTLEERYMLARLRKQQPRLSNATIARIMGRHPSTISRELRRNVAVHDGRYRYWKAQEKTNARRRLSRRNSHFTAEDWAEIERLLGDYLSPEQISGRLRLEGRLNISHETIYMYIWQDKWDGGELYRCLRQPIKRRKRYASRERRGRLPGKRHISERPAAVELREERGHWELDTVMGAGTQDCVVTLVERATGFTLIGKLEDRTVNSLNARLMRLIRKHPGLFKTITADNGTEFHGYRRVERKTGIPFYFATPYHSWERGTSENTNGLIRQYLPKRRSMQGLTQIECNAIARKLNRRPRKRYGFLTPEEKLLLGKKQNRKIGMTNTGLQHCGTPRK